MGFIAWLRPYQTAGKEVFNRIAIYFFLLFAYFKKRSKASGEGGLAESVRLDARRNYFFSGMAASDATRKS